MKFLLILFIGQISLLAHGKIETAKADRSAWGGFWWSMRNAELALGWDGSYERKRFTTQQVELFSNCLHDSSQFCQNIILEFTKNNAISLSPLMKFDLFMKKYVDKEFGENAPEYLYSKSAMKELEIHYINNDPTHRHYKSKAFAGKCIGWALSNFDFNEPTKVKTINGIDFTPADIKGILAAIYNGAQFFIPDHLVVGTEYRNQGKNSQAYKDVTPLQFLKGLRSTIGQGTFLEADLDPGFGVWNYPIHSYKLITEDIDLEENVAKVKIEIEFANDEVAIDTVFSTQTARKDMKQRTYTANFTLPEDWDHNLASAIDSEWTGISVNNHPDAIIFGLEDDWREIILEYEDTEMATEVNFELLKSHDGFTSVVDTLLKNYYSNSN